MDFYKGVIPILDDSAAARDFAHPRGAMFGAVERDWKECPESFMAQPTDMKLIPESDLDAWYDEQEAQKSSLEHIYLANGPSGPPLFTNLDQNGNGYCWAYSTGQAIMMKLAAMGMTPPVRLNPHGPAAIIKGGRDEGGWCGLSAKFSRETGYPEEGTGPGQWPLHSRNLKYDTPECRAAMAKYKVTEDWVDLTKQVYDQDLTNQQLWTTLNQNNPSPIDLADWGHSVCAIRWVRVERGAFAPLILNSWLGWGRFGLAVLSGSMFRSKMGAISIRQITA